MKYYYFLFIFFYSTSLVTIILSTDSGSLLHNQEVDARPLPAEQIDTIILYLDTITTFLEKTEQLTEIKKLLYKEICKQIRCLCAQEKLRSYKHNHFIKTLESM